jgi:hypothetical protein
VFADFCASTISAAAAAFAVLANLMHARALGFVCTHHEAIYTKHKHHKEKQKAQTNTHKGPPSPTRHTAQHGTLTGTHPGSAAENAADFLSLSLSLTLSLSFPLPQNAILTRARSRAVYLPSSAVNTPTPVAPVFADAEPEGKNQCHDRHRWHMHQPYDDDSHKMHAGARRKHK